MSQTKFFTNQDGNTLLEKFQGIFQWCDVYHFDALVGFFYASGYFRLRPSLGQVSKIRILVGMEVEELVVRYERLGKKFHGSSHEIREEMMKQFVRDIQSAEYAKEVEEGIEQLVKDVASRKLEIRVHPSKEIHAKIYVFRQEVEHTHPGYGAVITGSSNLSISGLEKNFEFNVELRDYPDIKYAKEVFEALWAESKELEYGFFSEVEKATYLQEGISPFEVYIKFLTEHFGSSVTFDPEIAGDVPEGFFPLRYQIDAMNEGLRKLKLHNGFFLADVVGLGKTVVGTMIARKFSHLNGGSHVTRILVVAPPHLVPNWKLTMRQWQVQNVDFVSNATLNKVKESADFHHPSEYDLILVDEAHRFRNHDALGYEDLQNICKTKRKREGNFKPGLDKFVILISATPLNNKPDDLRNQILLFMDSKQNTLDVNLQSYFSEKSKKFQEIKSNKSKETKDLKMAVLEINHIYKDIREKVLAPIVLRRTRSDIQDGGEYQKDIDRLKIHFPNIIPPKQLLYQLDANLEALYDNTRNYLNSGLKYARYQAIAFLMPPANEQFPQRERVSKSLAWIMRTLMIKRLDSSFYSFKRTLGAYHRANGAMLQMFENGRIFIAPEEDVVDKVLEGGKTEDDFFDYLLAKTSEDGRNYVFEPDQFMTGYLENLKTDQEILTQLVEKWDQVDQDPKLDLFLEKIRTEFFGPLNEGNKLVIFSEYKDTTQYLEKALKSTEVGQRVISVDSGNKDMKREVILANFDANQTNLADDYDILISTEVLAEGINLHRSNVIINYDTPWNSTRLMQRIGRVNRIGSKAQNILVYNFLPTAKVEGDIELKRKAVLKLQAFHKALGEDSTIYSPEDEETESFGMFEKMEVEEKDRRLELLKWLREYRSLHPRDFERIQNLPHRTRAGRHNRVVQGKTAVYLRTELREAFTVVGPGDELEELSFMDMAELLKASELEQAIPLHRNHHDQVTNAFDAFINQRIGGKATVKSSFSTDKKEHSVQDKQVIAALDKLGVEEYTTPLEEDWLRWAIEMIEIGRFEPLPKKLNKIRKKFLVPTMDPKKKTFESSLEALEEMLHVIKSFPRQLQTQVELHEEGSEPKKPIIVVSESFSIR
jgi:superfamily II DNA or RNA helicase